MHISEMESTIVSYENYVGQLGEVQAQARAELAGRQSNYMTNMILPEIVKSSKNYPLGPECVITRDSKPDESVLVDMDLYWLISHENGCVEMKVAVNDSASGPKAVTHDPVVIVTRKPRRFEAYCCTVCRQNFVTVVQALLHMKAFHRKDKKILIQDQNVFHDIEKAMEVPPVPLPWYIAKRVNEQALQLGTSTPGSAAMLEGDQTTTTVKPKTHFAGNTETNPVTVLLQAIVKEYGKQVQTVLFGKGLAQVKFEDNTSIVAHLPDLTNQNQDNKTDINMNDKLEFQVHRVEHEGDRQEDSCVVRANNPVLAQKLIAAALKRGVAQGSGSDLPGQNVGLIKDGGKSTTTVKPDSVPDERTADSPPQVKLDSRGRPSKTVRFMLGAPDSDEDGSSSASERLASRESASPTTSAAEADAVSLPEVPRRVPSSESLKTKEDEGLQGVVDKLISTASKGIISPVEPVSPVPTVSTSLAPGIREELIATASLHARYMPKNRSVPNLSSLAVPVSMSLATATVPPSVTAGGLVRVQSWGGAGGSDPLQRFSLSAYTPATPQSFDHMSRDELRKSFLTVGRSFTYAEKIKLMNKLNDEDALITQEHVKGAGKRLVAEASRQDRNRIGPSTVIKQISEDTDQNTVVSDSSKPKQGDLKTDHVKLRNAATDVKKKRKSKYDVGKFVMTDESGDLSGLKEKKYPNARESGRSSSEGSLSDRDDDTGAMDEKDENPPTLLEVLRTNLGKPGYLAPASGPSTSEHIPTSYASMLSDSEYYGSGEWANAAMQTLRNLQNLQSKVNSGAPSADKSEEQEQKKLTSDDHGDSRPPSPFVNINTELTSRVAAPATPFVPVSSTTKTDGSAVDTIMALAQKISAEQAQLVHLTKPDELSKMRSQRKRSLSPRLNDEERQVVKTRPGSNASDHQSKKAKKDKAWQWHGAKSEMNSSNKKKTTVTSRRSSDSVTKSVMIADKGDSLQFMESLNTSSLGESDEVLMKFCRGSSSESDSGVDASADMAMDMPQIFMNSIETLVKVRYIEKVRRCRVCGYSVVINSSNGESILQSHVMEHSLKELLQAGCNGKQLI